jgi:hypothetical protein
VWCRDFSTWISPGVASPSSPKELTHPFDELPTGQSIGFNFGEVTLVDCGQRFTWGKETSGCQWFEVIGVVTNRCKGARI